MARGSCAFTQRDVKAVVKAVAAAGVEVARVKIDRDGNIIVEVGKSDSATDTKEIVL